MHDKLFIWRDGKRVMGSRYLWADDRGAVFQTIFYMGRNRPDPAPYAQVTTDDGAMNAVASRLLTDLVDEARKARN